MSFWLFPRILNVFNMDMSWFMLVCLLRIVSYMSRDDDYDSVAKMKAAEEALEAKNKVILNASFVLSYS